MAIVINAIATGAILALASSLDLWSLAGISIAISIIIWNSMINT